MDTGQPALKLSPPKSWLFSGQKKKYSGGGGELLFPLYLKNRPKVRFFWRKLCHSNFDSREQQAILPDEFDHARLIAIGYPNSR
jgi:hypothetical protein